MIISEHSNDYMRSFRRWMSCYTDFYWWPDQPVGWEVGNAEAPGAPFGVRWLAVTAACGLAGWAGSSGAGRAGRGGAEVGWSGRELGERHSCWAAASGIGWGSGPGCGGAARHSSGGPTGGRSPAGPGRARRAGGAHCTGAASGAAGGRADLSAGHFLVQGHCKSVGGKTEF